MGVCGMSSPEDDDSRVGNRILASEDQVAVDAVSAKMMGFDPLKIPFIKIAHDKGLGVGDVGQIEIVGDDVKEVNYGFATGRSPVIFFDQSFRKNSFNFLEPLLFHTPLFKLCILASHVYHDLLWYPIIGRKRIRGFNETPWGELFNSY